MSPAISLAKRSAFVYFDGLDDRETTRGEITDDLIRIGCIEDGPEAFRRFQENQALGLMREHRKSKAHRGEIQLELVSLYRLDEDGNKKQYFKACGKLTPTEAAQHIQYWDEKLAEDEAQRERYYAFHMKRHGKKLQRLLDFEHKNAS